MTEPLSDARLEEATRRWERFAALPTLNALETEVSADRALLLAEVKRLRVELADALLVAAVHDKLQDAGPHNCARCRLEGRKEGLLEAAEMLEGRPFGPHTSPHIDAPLLKAAARLRALAGQVDA